MTDVGTIAYTIAILVALAYGWREGVQGLLVASVFLMPWYGLMHDVGLSLTPDRIVGVFLMAGLVLRFKARALSVFWLFVAYFVLATIALSLSLPTTVADYSPARAEWRWSFQIGLWMLLVAPGSALGSLGSRRTISQVLRALLSSGTILGALAIIQFVTFYLTGIDLFPIGITADLVGRQGTFEAEGFLGGSVFRACALGGEPKHLAYTMALCLTVLLADRLLGGLISLGRRTYRLAAAICVAALVLTFSTQGFVLLTVNAAVLATSVFLARGATRRLPAVAIGWLLLGGLLWFAPELATVLYERTIGRMAETGGIEDWNEAVWGWFSVSSYAWPFGVGLGNVHLYAASYIPAEYLYYMRGNVFVAKSGALRLASELGLVGLSIFLGTAIYPLTKLWRSWRKGAPLASAASACTMAAVADFLLTNDGPTYVFLFIGVAAAAAAEVHSNVEGVVPEVSRRGQAKLLWPKQDAARG